MVKNHQVFHSFPNTYPCFFRNVLVTEPISCISRAAQDIVAVLDSSAFSRMVAWSYMYKLRASRPTVHTLLHESAPSLLTRTCRTIRFVWFYNPRCSGCSLWSYHIHCTATLCYCTLTCHKFKLIVQRLTAGFIGSA